MMSSQDQLTYIADQRWSLLTFSETLSPDKRRAALSEGLRQALHREDARPDDDNIQTDVEPNWKWVEITTQKREQLHDLIGPGAALTWGPDSRIPPTDSVGPSQENSPVDYRVLVLIDGAGMGKTTTTEMIHYAFTQPEFHGTVACWIEASQLPQFRPGADYSGELLNQLMQGIKQRLKVKDEEQTEQKILKRLRRARDQEKLVVIVDALDQATDDLDSLVWLLTCETWKQVRWVVAGRPLAFKLQARGLLQLDSRGMRFVRLDEFSEDQKERYLTVPGEPVSRYRDKRLTEELKEVLGNPRMLEVLRTLDRADFEGLKTPADLLSRGLWRMLRKGFDKPRSDIWLTDDLETNVKLAEQLLATVAFLMMANEPAPPRKNQPNFDGITEARFDGFRNALWQRFKTVAKDEVDGCTPDRMIKALGKLGLILRSDLLLPSSDDQPLKPTDARIKFLNKTWQEYLCAVYLGKYATEHDLSIVWRQNWIVEWDRKESQAYQEMWRYFCDLPVSARIDEKWLETTALFYQPGKPKTSSQGKLLFDQAGELEWEELPRRPAEFIYRTWWRLNELAEEPWNRDREWRFNKDQQEPTTDLATRARKIREDWWGEFELILNHGVQGTTRQRIAQSLRDSFIPIPTGTFWFGERESAQQLVVDEFGLSREAVRNEWLRLFVPRHGLRGEFVDEYTFYSGDADTPAIYADWYLSWAFAMWTRWENRSCRLPLEAEFERVGKFDMETKEQQLTWWFWWHASEFDRSKCNANNTRDHTTKADPAHAIPGTIELDPNRAKLGIMDLLGNVWIWMGESYESVYDYEQTQEDLFKQLLKARSVRGGAFNGSPGFVRVAWRSWDHPVFRVISTGCRFARTL